MIVTALDDIKLDLRNLKQLNQRVVSESFLQSDDNVFNILKALKQFGKYEEIPGQPSIMTLAGMVAIIGRIGKQVRVQLLCTVQTGSSV